MPPQLRGRDLRGGDILLKANAGTFTSRLIHFGQKLVGAANAQIVHAGIMYDPNYIIEASGPGLKASDLRVQDKAFGYLVFRCTNPNLAAGAATCAKLFFDIQGRTGKLKYNAPGALGSLFGSPGRAASPEEMDALLERMLQDKSHRFFCSQFVVYVYQYVAEQNGMAAGRLFNFSDAKVPPSTLAASLSSHPLFQETGYLMPNER